MKWFKHDSGANMDGKLQEVLLDYGLEGYGLYFYCLELISAKIEKENVSFKLEHDARIIARNTGSTAQKVQDIMNRFVELGLFEVDNGQITCFKMASRLDQSMTSNPAMRQIINQIKINHDDSAKSHDPVMIASSKSVTESCKTRLDKTRLDKNKVPYQLIVDLFHSRLPELSSIKIISDKRKRSIKRLFDYDAKHNVLEWWDQYFTFIRQSDFLMGRVETQNQNHATWKCDFEFLINLDNFIKIIEGKYK